ncbi:MAG: ComA operon protein 2, partial [uncultured Blastococcus sp.]
ADRSPALAPHRLAQPAGRQAGHPDHRPRPGPAGRDHARRRQRTALRPAARRCQLRPHGDGRLVGGCVARRPGQAGRGHRAERELPARRDVGRRHRRLHSGPPRPHPVHVPHRDHRRERASDGDRAADLPDQGL